MQASYTNSAIQITMNYQLYGIQQLKLIVPESTTTTQLTQKIQKQFWIDPPFQLSFGKCGNSHDYWIRGQIGSYCKGRKQISLIIIKQDNKDVTMNAMNSEEIKILAVKAVTNAKSARIAKPGGSLLAICREKKCDAFGRQVIINIGFGTNIDINKCITTAECPLCHQKTNAATNIGFYKCKAIIKGEKSNGKPYPQKQFLANHPFYQTFCSGNEYSCQWAYIIATIEKI